MIMHVKAYSQKAAAGDVLSKKCSKIFPKVYKKTPVPEVCNFIKKETLTQVLSYELYEIFKNTFSTEQLHVTDPDIRIQVVVICKLNLSSQFVAIHFTFSLLIFHCCRMLQCRLYFCIDLPGLFLAAHCKTTSKEK